MEAGRSKQDFSSVKNILLDIEGTTTSIKFVTEVLFPYARQNLPAYLDENWSAEEVQESVNLLRKQCSEDEANGVPGVPKIFNEGENANLIRYSVIENIFWQMDSDRKTTALKELQGKMYKSGFASGALRGHVYDDVPEAFKRWINSGKRIYIYSSGSVEAQKLLYGHSEAGDLTQFISGYFDTTTGPKRESKSYKLISTAVGCAPETFLFFTDIPAEAYAAKDAGMHACLIVRPGNAPLTDEEKKGLLIENDFNWFL